MIREATPDDVEHCISVATALRDWFTPEAIERMRGELEGHILYIAEDKNLGEGSGAVIGFMSAAIIDDGVAEIFWAGVHPEHRRAGVGSALLAALVESLAGEGVRTLTIRTLSERVDYAPYEQTRAWLAKNDFFLMMTIDPYPEWGPGNICAVYVKQL